MTDKNASAEWISTVAYGKRYGIDSRTVRKWMDAGLLRTYRVDKTIRVLNKPPSEQGAKP